MLSLEKLLSYGVCKATAADISPCEGCPFDFEYEGQYYGDTPYPACEVIKDIILHAARIRKEKEDNKNREQLAEKIDIKTILREIGHRIGMYRKAKRLTQQDLADKMTEKHYRTTITAYEAGRIMIPIERLYEIADILGVTVYELLP